MKLFCWLKVGLSNSWIGYISTLHYISTAADVVYQVSMYLNIH